MPDEAQVERRLKSLEQAVARLQDKLAVAGSENWLDKIAGSISDDQAFDKALEYGRELRQEKPISSSDPA